MKIKLRIKCHNNVCPWATWTTFFFKLLKFSFYLCVSHTTIDASTRDSKMANLFSKYIFYRFIEIRWKKEKIHLNYLHTTFHLSRASLWTKCAKRRRRRGGVEISLFIYIYYICLRWQMIHEFRYSENY